ncbi:MAG: hypothetical protein ABI051_11995 [Vicinamibacterales bacterium]
MTGSQATAFRSRYVEDLLPTLKQLQRTQPEATLKWFERERLWDSPEAAEEAGRRVVRPRGRGPGWRPGGAHVDPRAKYDISRDEKRARFKKRMISSAAKPSKTATRTFTRPKPPKDSK